MAFAQSLHLPLANEEASRMIMTTTLAITVFTNVVLGGCTLPLVKVSQIKYLSGNDDCTRNTGNNDVSSIKVWM